MTKYRNLRLSWECRGCDKKVESLIPEDISATYINNPKVYHLVCPLCGAVTSFDRDGLNRWYRENLRRMEAGR